MHAWIGVVDYSHRARAVRLPWIQGSADALFLTAFFFIAISCSLEYPFHGSPT